MTLSRRALFLLSGLAIAVIAAALGVLLATRGDDGGRKFAGRIAVVNGCGLLDMFADGRNRKRLCLSHFWAAASVSDNGKTLAWDTLEKSKSGIVVAALDVKFTEAKNEQQLPVPAGANAEPTLSPDGNTVAFLHSPKDDGRYDIWTTPATTTTERAEQVTATRSVSTAAWSPLGDWIAYVRNWSEETLEGDIVLVRPDGADERRLGKGDAPSWAPDGRRLVFVRNQDIWTMRSDGTASRLLVPNGHAPAWSRDGKLIAFARELKCGQPVCRERIFLQFATGGEPRPLGPTLPGIQRLLWLPDPSE